MKKATRFTALILAVIAAFSMPFYAYGFTSKTIFTSSTYTHQDKYKDYELLQGIDVSNHNATIDWAKVKKAGVKFAIVRIGCRGYASAGTLLEDSLYKKNIEGAYNAGLDVGVYFYSQAITKAEAKEEANFVLERIKAYKSKITLPVYFDYEFAPVSSGRLNKAWNNGDINKTQMTTFAKTFCNVFINNGYEAGIYASKYFFYDNLNYAALQEKYDIWLAHYATKTDYKGEFSIWQFSEKGTVSGINGNVDSNFMYNKKVFDDFTIPDQAYTGEEIYPDLEITYNGKALRFGVDYYISITNNINYGTASVTVTGVNDYADLTQKTYKFNIVPTVTEGLKLTKRKSDEASLKWNAHPEAEGYQIRACGPDGWYVAGETDGTAYTVKELDGATKYLFTVSAIKTVGGKKYYGIPSSQLTVITKPAKVKGIKASSRTAKSLKLKWTKQPCVELYSVYKYNADEKKYELYAETNKNTITVKKLKANTAYKFKIRASVVTEKGTTVYGLYSATYKDYTVPKAPTLKSAVSKSAHKITAKWKAVSGAKGYQVMWSTTSDFSSNTKSVKVKGATKTTVTTARSGANYYVRVRAYVTRGGKNYYSSWSKTIGLVTK